MHRSRLQTLIAIAALAWPGLASAQDAPPPEAVEPAPAESGEAAPVAVEDPVEPLARILTPGDVEARIAAVTALGARLDDSAAVAALIAVLRSDPAPEVRAHALHALGAVGSEEARAAIREARGYDPDPRVVSVAGLILTQATEAHNDLNRRNGRSSVTIGITLLCLSYGVTLFAGLIASAIEASHEDEHRVGWWLLVPLAGPFLAGPDSGEPEKTYLLASLDAACEIAGIALLFVGLAQHVRYERETRELGASSRAARRRPMIAPALGRGVASIGVTGVF